MPAELTNLQALGTDDRINELAEGSCPSSGFFPPRGHAAYITLRAAKPPPPPGDTPPVPPLRLNAIGIDRAEIIRALRIEPRSIRVPLPALIIA